MPFPHRNQLKPGALERFVEALRESPHLMRAARAGGHTIGTFKKYKKLNPEFSEAWDDAMEEGIERAEVAVHDRAFIGVDRPVFQQGVEVGTVKEYSDSLAMFLLKAHKPEKYRERTEVKHSGAASITVITGVPQTEIDDLV